MKRELAVPVSLEQVAVANRLHEQLIQWQVKDRALDALHMRFTGFNIEVTVLKVAAVNQLYRTNVYAVDRMAKHIESMMCENEQIDDVRLVEDLASLPGRKHISFSSKFAHFFIDKERFPIYDSFAEDMVKFHLGHQNWNPDKEHPYRACVQNLTQLKEQVCLQGACTYESLDRYLWITGLYKAYKTRANPKINREVEELFKSLSINEAPTSLLQEMLPPAFSGLVRRKRRVKKGEAM
jgi:hypothetical protein